MGKDCKTSICTQPSCTRWSRLPLHFQHSPFTPVNVPTPPHVLHVLHPTASQGPADCALGIPTLYWPLTDTEWTNAHPQCSRWVTLASIPNTTIYGTVVLRTIILFLGMAIYISSSSTSNGNGASMTKPNKHQHNVACMEREVVTSHTTQRPITWLDWNCGLACEPTLLPEITPFSAFAIL